MATRCEMFLVAINPNGITAQSPGLRGTRYPGSLSAKIPNRNAVAANVTRMDGTEMATTALRLNPSPNCNPR